MNWYLIHTKPRQERCALNNLQWQGYECYFPTMPAEKIRLGKLGVIDQMNGHRLLKKGGGVNGCRLKQFPWPRNPPH